jgi:hypothetical protein
MQPRVHRLPGNLDLVQARLDRLVEIRMSEPDQDRPLVGILGIQQGGLPILLDRTLARPVIQRREREADARFT